MYDRNQLINSNKTDQNNTEQTQPQPTHHNAGITQGIINRNQKTDTHKAD